MSFFAHEEGPKHPSKTLSHFRAAMKEALGQFCACIPSSSTLNIEEESTVSDINDEQEVVIQAIRTAMEAKLRRKQKLCPLPTHSSSWLSSTNTAGELITATPNSKRISSQQQQQQQQQQLGYNLEEEDDDDDGKETFFSAESCFSSVSKEVFFSAGRCFSRCSSTSREVFLSSRSCLSRCSSARVIDFSNVNGRCLIMQEFGHCEGWPFGLGRKAMLLPPLPKSPSESWSWRRPPQMVKPLK